MVISLLSIDSLNAQVFFSNSQRSVGQIDPNVCRESYLPLFNELSSIERRYFRDFNDLAIHPDGRLFGFAVSNELRESYLVEIDVLNVGVKDTLLTLGSGESYGVSALVIDSSGVFYFGGSHLQSYDPATGNRRIHGIMPWHGSIRDLVFIQNDLYGSTRLAGSTNLYKVDLFFPEDSELVFQDTTGEVCLDGMATWFDPQTRQKRLIASTSCDRGMQHLGFIDIASGQYAEHCSFISYNNSEIEGLTSEDEFRTNFSLRLDLDRNNSRGRLVDHVLMDSLCAVRVPIADRDVWVQSLGGPVDSIHIEIMDGIIHPGEEVLFAQAHPDFTIHGQGTNHLVAINTGQVPDSVVSKFLRQIHFEILVEKAEKGQREIHTQLFADGQASDVARTFIPIDTDIPLYAGEDVTVEVCDGYYPDLLDYLPEAETYGRWLPVLFRQDDEFSTTLDEPGVYQYIVENGGCLPDTAEVTVTVFEAPPLNVYGESDMSFFPPEFFCSGDTVIWDISERVGDLEYSWEGGLEGPVQQFTVSDRYKLRVYDESTNCRFEYEGYFYFLDTSRVWNETREVCFGDTVEWVGNDYVVFQDTTICVVSSTVDSCQITNCLEISVLGNEMASIRRETICEGETYNFFGESLTEPDTYAKSIPVPFSCDSMVALDLSVRPSYSFFVDTTISEGQFLNIAGQTISAPGDYEFSYQTESGCDSIYQIEVALVTNTHDGPSDSDIWANNLLKVQQDGYQLRSYSTSSIRIEEMRIVDMLGRNHFQATNVSADDPAAQWTPVAAGSYWCHAQIEVDGRKSVFRQKIVVVE